MTYKEKVLACKSVEELKKVYKKHAPYDIETCNYILGLCGAPPVRCQNGEIGIATLQAACMMYTVLQICGVEKQKESLRVKLEQLERNPDAAIHYTADDFYRLGEDNN